MSDVVLPEFDVISWSEDLADRDIRVAFFDVDGTLLGLDGSYSQRLQQALQATREQGIRTAIASGRPPYATRFLIDELGLADAGVFYTGALVYDPATDLSIQATPLASADAQSVLAMARAQNVYAEVCTATDFFVEAYTTISDVHSQHLRIRPKLADLESVVAGETVFKLLLAVDEVQQPGALQAIERAFPQLVFAYACLPSYPSWSFVSIISPRACKKQAFQQLLDYHQVNANQVIAFGDADSDRDFLSLAGMGVAMGNAKPEIQQVADRVTLTAAEDGVARVLEVLVQTR